VHPIKTETTDIVYQGDGSGVADLWVEREEMEVAASFDGATAIHSYWTFSEEERRRIFDEGANIRLSILGEPIPPSWLEVVNTREVE
jgi:hypothetical protein